MLSPIVSQVIRRSAFVLALVMALESGALATEQDRVVMQSPAKDAAVLAKMPGFVNNVKAKTLSGLPRTMNDGVVIRKSYIRDGKIVIPPSGLYFTMRSENWHPLDGEPLTVAGVPYEMIAYTYTRDVVRDVTFKKGQIIPIDRNKTRGFELSDLDNAAYGMDGASSVTFKFVKATGNYYGQDFPVYVGPKVSNSLADGSFAKGSDQPAGHTVPTAKNRLAEGIWGTNTATVGRTHIIVDKVEGSAVKVREMATDTCDAIFLGSGKPVAGAYAKGDTFKAGEATVQVTEVTKNSATVKITDKKGVVSKTFGPLTPENTKMMFMSMVDVGRFWARSSSGNVMVHVNLRSHADPFADGKVQLVAYGQVLEINDGTVWPVDPRFMARPET